MTTINQVTLRETPLDLACRLGWACGEANKVRWGHPDNAFLYVLLDLVCDSLLQAVNAKRYPAWLLSLPLPTLLKVLKVQVVVQPRRRRLLLVPDK